MKNQFKRKINRWKNISPHWNVKLKEKYQQVTWCLFLTFFALVISLYVSLTSLPNTLDLAVVSVRQLIMTETIIQSSMGVKKYYKFALFCIKVNQFFTLRNLKGSSETKWSTFWNDGLLCVHWQYSPRQWISYLYSLVYVQAIQFLWRFLIWILCCSHCSLIDGYSLEPIFNFKFLCDHDLISEWRSHSLGSSVPCCT